MGLQHWAVELRCFKQPEVHPRQRSRFSIDQNNLWRGQTSRVGYLHLSLYMCYDVTSTDVASAQAAVFSF